MTRTLSTDAEAMSVPFDDAGFPGPLVAGAVGEGDLLLLLHELVDRVRSRSIDLNLVLVMWI